MKYIYIYTRIHSNTLWIFPRGAGAIPEKSNIYRHICLIHALIWFSNIKSTSEKSTFQKYPGTRTVTISNGSIIFQKKSPKQRPERTGWLDYGESVENDDDGDDGDDGYGDDGGESDDHGDDDKFFLLN